MADDNNNDKYITETEQVIPPALKSDPDSVFKKGNKIATNFETGEIIPAILESSHPQYKTTAENTTDKPVIFINPEMIREKGFPRYYIETRNQIMGHNIDISKTSKIIGTPNNGNTNKESGLNDINEKIEGLINRGPAAVKGSDFCIINLPETEIIGTHNRYLQSIYKNSNIAPPTGTEKDWETAIGAHEGEHCNQDYIESDEKDRLSYIKTSILGETLSDRHGSDVLRSQGKEDVIEYRNHLRAVAAIYDKQHATGIFLGAEKNPTEINNEQAIAAVSFSYIAALAVSNRLNISLTDSKNMMQKYPKEFTEILKEERDKGNLQTGEMSYIDFRFFDVTEQTAPLICLSVYQKEKMIEQMGITEKEYDNLDEKRIPDIINAHQSLQDNGVFPKENKYVGQYIDQYINGVDKIIGDNKEPYKPYSQVNEERNLEREAFNSLDSIINRAIAQELGISENDASELHNSDIIADKQKYLNALESAMKTGKINTMTTGQASDEECNKIVARRMGTPEDKINPESHLHSKIKGILMHTNAFDLSPIENPHILPLIQQNIETMKNNLEAETQTHESLEDVFKKAEDAKKPEEWSSLGTSEKSSSIKTIKENFSSQDATQGRKYAVNISTPQYSSAPTV